MSKTGTIVITVVVTAVVVVLLLAFVGMQSEKHSTPSYSDSNPSSSPSSSNVAQGSSSRGSKFGGSGQLDSLRDLAPAQFAPNATDLKDYLRSMGSEKTLVQTNDALVCDQVIGEEPQWIRARESFMHACALGKDADELRAYDRHSSSAHIQMFLIMTGDQNVPNSRRAWVVQPTTDVDRSSMPASFTNMPFLDFMGYGDTQ